MNGSVLPINVSTVSAAETDGRGMAIAIPWGVRQRALRQSMIRNAPEQGQVPKETCSLPAD